MYATSWRIHHYVKFRSWICSPQTMFGQIASKKFSLHCFWHSLKVHMSDTYIVKCPTPRIIIGSLLQKAGGGLSSSISMISLSDGIVASPYELCLPPGNCFLILVPLFPENVLLRIAHFKVTKHNEHEREQILIQFLQQNKSNNNSDVNRTVGKLDKFFIW